MKKLTTGIFTVLLGLVAADANASIASKAYVDQERDKVQGNVTTLTNTVNTFKEGINTTITNQIKEELNSDTSEISKALDAKADATDVTALTGRVTTAEGEIDALQTADTAFANKLGDLPENKTVAQAIEDAASGASDATDALAERVTTNETAIKNINEGAVMTSGITVAGVTQIGANKTAIEAINNTETGILKQAQNYADQAETDAIAAAKTAGDQAYAVKSTETVASNNATAIGTLGSLTTSVKTNLVAAVNEVDAAAKQNAEDITAINSTLEGVATDADLTELKNKVDNETTGLAATKAIADANKSAIENATSGLAAAHTAIADEKTRAEAAEKENADALAAFKDSFKKTASSEDGKYVLTVNQTNGEQTFYWEQIERATPASGN